MLHGKSVEGTMPSPLSLRGAREASMRLLRRLRLLAMTAEKALKKMGTAACHIKHQILNALQLQVAVPIFFVPYADFPWPPRVGGSQ